MALVFRGTKKQLVRKLHRIAKKITGEEPDPTGIGKAVVTAIGFAALSDIRDAYVTKSRGGTDAMGIRWPPLKPQTIANRAVGPKDKKNSYLIRQRERIRKREEKKAFKRFLMSMSEGDARARARRVASFKATQETGKTKVETLGGRQVEILRDTGLLLNSLTPGTFDPTAGYRPPAGDGGSNQIFNVNAGIVAIGTNLPYASVHNDGDQSRNIPRRQFLPDKESQIPEQWWGNWTDAAMRTLEVLLAKEIS